MLQAMKHAPTQCYIPRKHAQLNRQPRRLEITLSRTKQSLATQFNRQFSATFSKSQNTPNPPTNFLATNHSSLTTAFFTTRRISNRHTPRLESAISRRKQTLATRSDRHSLRVSASHQRRIADADRPPQVASNIVSNRQWQILENAVNLSKQMIAPRSNRHKNALFASRMGSRDAFIASRIGHGRRITRHNSGPLCSACFRATPITAVCASVKPMREYPHAKNTK